MTRIELDGEGGPIPVHALPAYGTSDDLAPTLLTFTEDTEFPIHIYRELGFTHYEVVAVGAAGGRGGNGVEQFASAVTKMKTSVPNSIWDLMREDQYYWDYFNQKYNYGSNSGLYAAPAFNKHHTLSPDAADWQRRSLLGREWDVAERNPDGSVKTWYFVSGGYRLMQFVASGPYLVPTGYWNTFQGTALQMFDATVFGQTKKLTYTSLVAAALSQSLAAGKIGGAGGGGGMHKTSGALADLPDVVSIGVGEAGGDGGWGQVKAQGAYTPSADELYDYYGSFDFVREFGFRDIFNIQTGGLSAQELAWKARHAEIVAAIDNFLFSYPEPHFSFGNPSAGGDGGASYFHDVCRASGGKGGGPGMIWDAATSKFVSHGHGGAGGSGGQLEAGGGGQGSALQGVNGFDGAWNPVTGIGKGGGGGKAGLPSVTTGTYDVRAMPGYYGSLEKALQHATPVTTHYPPSSGGRGSYAYVDVDKHGARGTREALSYQQPLSYGQSETGVILTTPKTEPSPGSGPGFGGGARPIPSLKVGSRAAGYSPKGVVVLRLIKIVE